MRFFSKKAREENKIFIFRALKSITVRFVVPGFNSAHGVLNTLIHLLHVKKLLGRSLLLLLVIAIGGVSIERAYSQAENRDAQLGVKSTLHVYPESVSESSWMSVEQVLSPDLDEEALYQEFSKHNAAHVPLPSEDEIEEVQVSPVQTTEQEVVSDQGETPVASSTDGTVEGSDAPATTGDPATEDLPEQQQSESEEQTDVQSEQETPTQTEVEIEAESEPEPEAEASSEPEPAESTSETSQPVVLKKSNRIIFRIPGNSY